jgi:hypothetical protein
MMVELLVLLLGGSHAHECALVLLCPGPYVYVCVSLLSVSQPAQPGKKCVRCCASLRSALPERQEGRLCTRREAPVHAKCTVRNPCVVSRCVRIHYAHVCLLGWNLLGNFHHSKCNVFCIRSGQSLCHVEDASAVLIPVTPPCPTQTRAQSHSAAPPARYMLIIVHPLHACSPPGCFAAALRWSSVRHHLVQA